MRITKNRGRKPIGNNAMTAAERMRRHRAKLKRADRPEALQQAWEACTKAERGRLLRKLRAAAAQRKKERRAELEQALAEKISGGRPMAPRGPDRA